VNIYTSTQPPQQVPRTQAAFNTALATAQASADPRFNQKEWDRNGVSRSKGTQYMGGIKGAQSLADGVASAYQIPMQDASTNADNTLAYQQMRENYGLGAGGIAMQDSYANALAALQRQQDATNMRSGVLGGLTNGWLDNFLGY